MDAISLIQPSVTMTETKEYSLNDKDSKPSLKEAARMFESYFIYTLLKEMRKTVPESGLLPSGPGQGFYELLLDRSLADKIAESQGFGLYQYLIRGLTEESNEGSY